MNILSFQRPAIASFACLIALLFAGSVYAAVGEKKPPPQEKREALELNTQEMQKPWQGDLPGMLDRRVIRVLTTYSKTFFFIDKGTQRGATHDIFIEYERSLNQQ